MRGCASLTSFMAARIHSRNVTKYPKGPAEKGRGNFSPIWEMSLHLFLLAKLDAPYCKEVCERGGYEPEGTNSDHPGLGTLTFRDK